MLPVIFTVENQMIISFLFLYKNKSSEEMHFAYDVQVIKVR